MKEENRSNQSTLAKCFWLDATAYEDLDEILASYIEPKAMFAQEMMKFDRFKAGGQNEIDQLLMQEKQNNPKRIPYYINLSYDYPGSFCLSYFPPNAPNPKRESIKVTPRGYRFRDQEFSEPKKLVNWFKSNWQKKPPRRETAPQSAPAPVNQMMPPVHSIPNPQPDYSWMNIQQPLQNIPQQPIPQYPPPSHTYPPGDDWGAPSDQHFERESRGFRGGRGRGDRRGDRRGGRGGFRGDFRGGNRREQPRNVPPPQDDDDWK